MTSFLGELRRRNVVKVAVAYAIVGWLLIEVSSTVLPIFEAPGWIVQVFTFFVILGFPLALILSWAYELTPDGVERTESVAASESITPATGTKLNVVIIGLLVVAVAFMFVDNYLLNEPEAASIADEAQPTVIPVADEPAPAIASEQPAAPLTAIAVLPFDNLSPDPDNSYFASGMHEEILNALAKLSALEVEARTSVLRYAENRPPIEEIAAELNVGSILEGSVRFANNRVRVTTQLIDAATGSHLWSETYEHEFEDIFAIESDVAMNIANALEAEFTAEEQLEILTPRSHSPTALALFWQAVESAGGGGWGDAILLLDRAIELDPEFSAAYVLRAWMNAGRLAPRSIQAADDADAFIAEVEALVSADLDIALSLDPAMGAAYTVMARVHEFHSRGVEALAAHERAYELQRNFPEVLLAFSQFSLRTGRFAEAGRLAEEAIRLDRGIGNRAWRLIGNARLYAGDLDGAEAAYTELLELAPANAHSGLGSVEAIRGNGTEAFAHLQTEEQLVLRPNPARLAELLLWYSVARYPDEAARLFELFEERIAASPLVGTMPRSAVNLAIGNTDEALRLLRSLTAEDDGTLGVQELQYLMKFNVANLPVLEQPEFVEVRERLGFRDL